MRIVEIHAPARQVIRSFSKVVRREVGEALMKLQLGMSLGLPVSRPMPSVYPGAHELRFRDASGIQRVFYYLGSIKGILVFHAFVKKTQKTPQREIKLARKRLTEMLDDEKK
jgi:phage-related protein